MRPHTPSAVLDECDVPLQQLARLKEKLIKHSRAEEAAVKRIRDLEMQLFTLKHECEVSYQIYFFSFLFLNALIDNFRKRKLKRIYYKIKYPNR